MRTWYFSEMAYHPAWQKGLERGSLRVNFPNEIIDPVEAGTLLNRYLDEFALCDEVGLDIMVNEHHSTATCMTVSVPMALAVIARETRKSRLLTLGNPIANRPDPVRVAEEMAWLDCLSGGRLEMGLVKGAPYEIHPANSNPGRLMRRYWEAHDLILKALSTHDGPFSWEGEYFQYRAVNIWPRPIQQPHPPVWMTGMSVETGILAAERGHVVGTLLSGGLAKPMYDAYRKRARELGREATADRFAYAAIVGVGQTRDEGLRRANQIADYVRTAPVVAEPFTNPPGYNSIGANVAMLKAGPRAHRLVTDRDGVPIDHRTATVQQFMDTETVFAGTPDDVFNQLKAFNTRMGGVGHLLFFGQGGYLSHQDAKENIRLFGQEVAPRLLELGAPEEAAAAE
ncbi:LLM class flavin-dependent oxidoreductase [Rhodopila sp.]|jgi:alkanesulfonate monooxygenase SsuD/methylene tetrahydromethanopterin reductase-like flavin-dependent oxidoreductase (luciferase family)|uniref:LLM class flavin-dependent oxidoreductase n=1 Tax=Rhodopila sp. TaxID=2480087 RepID=UPI002BFD6908|nr:LLM class flavin-dependent oxidoreductase [Rhodopila sp.]HVZ09733.1 LLM class flavin-dependent oxidoreductase [Rhodopila sp.]